MDVARSIQLVTGGNHAAARTPRRELTGLKNLCMAGGVAHNCVANGRISGRKIFERIWIQPAAGDAGGAPGAALAAWHAEEKPRVFPPPQMPCKPHARNRDILTARSKRCCARTMRDFKKLETGKLLDLTVEMLKAEKSHRLGFKADGIWPGARWATAQFSAMRVRQKCSR